MQEPRDGEWVVGADDAGRTVTAFLRARLATSWRRLEDWVARGKVSVDGTAVRVAGQRLTAGERVALRLEARAPAPAHAVTVVHEDPHVIVIDKPAGMSSVPYDEREEGATALDDIRNAWRRAGRSSRGSLRVVHRIDRGTSGLLVFARTQAAERHLAAQFRAHSVDRRYTCVAHGRVEPSRIESALVADRGDGLRGSARRPGQGRRAVTHVRPVEDLRASTLCEVRLETGKTHQIRIHLAEQGHPLVGERVYVRDFVRDGGVPLDSQRLLLHAATLGFLHPATGLRMHFESALPPDFLAALVRLRT